MVVKKVATADAKVAPGFEGGEPLTLANSRGLKSALKFFVKIGLFLEFRRIPGRLGDGDGADAPGGAHAPHERSRAGLESEDAFDPPTPRI